MTCYQDCHRHLGYLTRETDIARKLLEKHGKASAQAVKELRGETDMPMRECADMLRCLRRDMELERLQTENAKLRQAFNETLARLVAANEVTVSDYMDDDYCELLRELGIEVD